MREASTNGKGTRQAWRAGCAHCDVRRDEWSHQQGPVPHVPALMVVQNEQQEGRYRDF